MTTVVNWLHLTDLHYGLDDKSWLWPSFRKDFLRDLESMSGQSDGWDLVFFTGDLVQRGDKREYDALSIELKKIWETLSKSGRVPLLCVVPGNHDLVRPDPRLASCKALTKLWQTDPELAVQFWRDRDCEYRKLVESSLKNYSEWYRNIDIPKIESIEGVLPGDFSATYSKKGINLGIVGLNTTFLQLDEADCLGRLDLHISQLNAVCGGSPDDWFGDKHASVLMTHHPSNWLSPAGIAHFRQHIYPPGRFISQLCGHQHEPVAFEMSESGAPARRVRQAPSLFGLKEWRGVHPQDRIHGYNAGQFIFEGEDGLEKYWPRTAILGRHGALHLCPDHTYQLQSGDCVISPFSVNGLSANLNELVADEGFVHFPPKSGGIQESSHALFEEPVDEEEARERLVGCQVFPILAPDHHKSVRKDEQSAFEHEIRKEKIIWLSSEWGIGKESFLASCLARFESGNQKVDAFVIKCDEVSNIDDIEMQFGVQFGMALQVFCSTIASLPNSFLIFEDLNADFVEKSSLDKLLRMASAIVDYCQNTKIVFVSRFSPPSSSIPTVRIGPLDVPDVRSYVTNHPDFQDHLKEPDIIEKLHEKSEGLPMHLDRMLKALQVSSLSSVLGNADDIDNPIAMEAETPRAIKNAVDSLARSTDRRSHRSFRLLKVLTILTYGETLDTLSHYLPIEPFFPDNAIQLSELTLIDILLLHRKIPQVSDKLSFVRQDSPRLLKVPRPVREYVNGLIGDSERQELVNAGIERYFGRSWRVGQIKLRSVRPEYKDYLNSGVGNEFALIKEMIRHAREIADHIILEKIVDLAVYYSNFLKNRYRYKDEADVSGVFTDLVDPEANPKDWAILAYNFGHGLRMSGKREEAIVYLEKAVEIGVDVISDSLKSHIYLNISLAEESEARGEAALAAAKKVIAIERPDSGLAMQAESVVIGQTLKGKAKTAALKRLEKRARELDHVVLADNISLELSDDESTAERQIAHLNKVLNCDEIGYNQARAIIAKAEAAGKLKVSLPHSEVKLLAVMYSYLYTQRLSGLFDRCHDALWTIFEQRGDSDQLIKLYRYASFLWRIRGDDEREIKYLKRLSDGESPAPNVSSSKLKDDVHYLIKRIRILFSRSKG